MIPFLFLLLLGPEKEIAQPITAAQARLDSLSIYMNYKESIDVLKAATDPYKWYAYEDSLSQKTACAFLRLSRYNKETYEPVMEFNREGMGVAFAYPQPTDEWMTDFRAKRLNHEAQVREEAKAKADSIAVASAIKEVGPIVFTVVGKQTHFMVSNNGKTKTPYVEMYSYAKGRVLVKIEKIDPVTFKPIEQTANEGKAVALTAKAE